MARIRSIHPGLFTDEGFMSASIPARMLIIGIWTEAFDDGVFEWKPITLKARIFPADNVDLPALLAELEALDFIKRFEVAGKSYGLIRNFCKWQRPKKPNCSGVLPECLHLYCQYSATSSEPVPNQFRTSTEIDPQMEDGGGREGGKKKDAAAAAAQPVLLEFPPAQPLTTDEAELFKRGKALLGNAAGGLVKKLIDAKGGNIALARAALETASTKGEPREYIGALLQARNRDSEKELARIRGDAW